MKAFLQSRWFLLLLTGALVFGFSLAPRLAPLAESRLLQEAVLVTVMFFMALPLELGAMTRALRRPAPVLLACGVNYGLLPLLAWGASLTLPSLLQAGLLVAAATPCTLASAAVWTRRAGGNDSVAVLVTILTNAGCFLLMPLWLALMTSRNVATGGTFTGMILKLALLVVLPMAAAQAVRLSRRAARWATERKTPLGVLAQCGVLTMVLIGCIRAGLQVRALPEENAPTLFAYLAMLAAVVFVHTAMLACGFQLARFCGLPRGDQIAVGFAGSQKTLMVGIHVAVTYFGGLAILPMVAYHVSQLLIDTLIADRLRGTG